MRRVRRTFDPTVARSSHVESQSLWGAEDERDARRRRRRLWRDQGSIRARPTRPRALHRLLDGSLASDRTSDRHRRRCGQRGRSDGSDTGRRRRLPRDDRRAIPADDSARARHERNGLALADLADSARRLGVLVRAGHCRRERLRQGASAEHDRRGRPGLLAAVHRHPRHRCSDRDSGLPAVRPAGRGSARPAARIASSPRGAAAAAHVLRSSPSPQGRGVMKLRALAAFAVVSACSTAALAQSPAPPSTLVDVQGGQIRAVTVASGLLHPWSIALLPDGRSMLVAERNGRVRLIQNDALVAEPVWSAEGMAAGNELKWLVLHPRFASNRLVYLSYPKAGERGTTLAIARGGFDGRRISDVEEIFVADAWETGGNLGGKILFGPDETLYVTVGDRDRLCCTGTEDNSLRMKAQDLSNHVGKTLRIRDDGSVPPDNPFVGRAGVKPEIFTYGHRNGYGLSFHPETGELWQAEIGPMGGDEVNILLPGHNYGWPLVSMGRNYTGSLVSDKPYYQDGMDNARMFWMPSISPSSLLFYTGETFANWRNNMFVGSLTGLALQRVAFGQPSRAERREPVLRALSMRIRDVQQSRDGYLYVATERSFGGNEPNGTVLRLEPMPTAAAPAATTSSAR